MNLNCLKGIINNNLAINLDISNFNSWDLNTGLTIISLNKWFDAKSDDIILNDFGLTNFDFGMCDDMLKSTHIKSTDVYFNMKRIGHNEVLNPDKNNYSGITASTKYDLYEINPIISGNSGNYFMLNGGYLYGCFKLYDYNFEQFPSRYNKGITIETILYLLEESTGIFYTMGVHSEDKYNPHYRGEFYSGETINGITTSYDNYLESYFETKTLKTQIRLPEEAYDNNHSKIEQIDNLKNNIIAFGLDVDKKIYYKYINSDGLIETNKSTKSLNNTGFTLISIAFIPNYVFDNNKQLKCSKQRFGTLSFYINGRLFWNIKDFPEFYFRELKNDKEKQIGIPFSISWGGGSFGLKHSWHYDVQTYDIFSNQNEDYVKNNFSIEDEYGDISNDLELNYNNSEIIVNHISGNCDFYSVKFINPIKILPNRNYKFSFSYKNENYINQLNNNLMLFLSSDDSNINIYDEIIQNIGNGWFKKTTILRVEDNSKETYVYCGVLIESAYYTITNKLYIKNINYSGSDILVQDDEKMNLTIEKNFNNPFIGGIQKLRLYDRGLKSNEILHNAIIESKLNENIVVNKGGRIIRT